MLWHSNSLSAVEAKGILKQKFINGIHFTEQAPTQITTPTNAHPHSTISYRFWHVWCWQSRSSFLCLLRCHWLGRRDGCRRCWRWGRGGGSGEGSSRWRARWNCGGAWEGHAGTLWPSPLSLSAVPEATWPCWQRVACKSAVPEATWPCWQRVACKSVNWCFMPKSSVTSPRTQLTNYWKQNRWKSGQFPIKEKWQKKIL